MKNKKNFSDNNIEQTTVLKVLPLFNETCIHVVLSDNIVLSYYDTFIIDGNMSGHDSFIVKSPEHLGIEAEIVPYGVDGYKYAISCESFKENYPEALSALKVGSKIFKIYMDPKYAGDAMSQLKLKQILKNLKTNHENTRKGFRIF
jgi:hypothetical protein